MSTRAYMMLDAFKCMPEEERRALDPELRGELEEKLMQSKGMEKLVAISEELGLYDE